MKDDGLKKMRREYETIPVPADLENKVRMAIEKGKAESDRELCTEQNTENKTDRTGGSKVTEFRKDGRTMKKSRYFVRGGQVAAAALVAVTLLANSNAEIAMAMEQIPVVGAVVKVVTFRSYEKQDGNMQADIQTPRVEADENSGISQAAEDVNRSVEEYTDMLIAEYEKDLEESGGDLHKKVDVSYEVITDNDRMFSLKIITDETMASAAESVRIYHIDKTTGQVMHLGDLFEDGMDYVKLLSDEVEKQMREQMANDEGKMYFLDSDVGENFEKIREDQTFYVDKEGHLVLVFDEYEVAPGYMGVVEFTMPESVWKQS